MPEYRNIQHPCATAYDENGGVFEFGVSEYNSLRKSFLEQARFFEGTGIDGDRLVISLDTIVAVGLESDESIERNNKRADERADRLKANELFE